MLLDFLASSWKLSGKSANMMVFVYLSSSIAPPSNFVSLSVFQFSSDEKKGFGWFWNTQMQDTTRSVKELFASLDHLEVTNLPELPVL